VWGGDELFDHMADIIDSLLAELIVLIVCCFGLTV